MNWDLSSTGSARTTAAPAQLAITLPFHRGLGKGAARVPLRLNSPLVPAGWQMRTCDAVLALRKDKYLAQPLRLAHVFPGGPYPSYTLLGAALKRWCLSRSSLKLKVGAGYSGGWDVSINNSRPRRKFRGIQRKFSCEWYKKPKPYDAARGVFVVFTAGHHCPSNHLSIALSCIFCSQHGLYFFY